MYLEQTKYADALPNRIGSKVVEPSWCGIGGHFEKTELNNARACVLRELYEEMKIPESALKKKHSEH